MFQRVGGEGRPLDRDRSGECVMGKGGRELGRSNEVAEPDEAIRNRADRSWRLVRRRTSSCAVAFAERYGGVSRKMKQVETGRGRERRSGAERLRGTAMVERSNEGVEEQGEMGRWGRGEGETGSAARE